MLLILFFSPIIILTGFTIVSFYKDPARWP